MVRELRARGWSYRDIGTAFAPQRRAAHALRDTEAHRRLFIHALDLVGDGVAFFDAAGTLLHCNTAFDRILERQTETVGLMDEVIRFAEQLDVSAHARERGAGGAATSAESVRREVRLPDGAYRLWGSHLELDVFGQGGTVVVAVQRRGDPSATEEALHARFGLSHQERRITRLLARGRSNADIAAALGISPHTARRHTEHVFSKLCVRSRAEVARRLREAEEDVTGNR